MLRITIFLTMLIVSMLAKSQETQTRQLSFFSKLDISGAITLVLQEGKSGIATITAAHPETLGEINFEEAGNTLYIRRARGQHPIQVTLSAPGLIAMKMDKHSIVKADKIETADFFLEVLAGSVFNGTIKASSTRINAGCKTVVAAIVETKAFFAEFSDGSWSDITGTSNLAMISAAKNVVCHLENFKIKKATISGSNQTTVWANVSDAIDISLDDTSLCFYSGDPQSTSLSGNIKKLDCVTQSKLKI